MGHESMEELKFLFLCFSSLGPLGFGMRVLVCMGGGGNTLRNDLQ